MPWDFWLIFLFLGIVIPWRGYTRLKKLLALPSVDTRAKVTIYVATIVFQWALVGVVAWRAFARGMTLAELGLGRGDWATPWVWGLAGAVVVGGLQWLNLRRIGRMGGEAPDLLRKLASRLLPVSRLEYLPYSVLAVTAGVCEEFVYRGFGMTAFSGAGLPPWAVVLVTSALFGLAHAYQGRAGIISTGILGVLLGAGRLVCGSLIPVMMWHAALDLAAGAAAPRYLLERPVPEEVQEVR